MQGLNVGQATIILLVVATSLLMLFAAIWAAWERDKAAEMIFAVVAGVVGGLTLLLLVSVTANQIKSVRTAMVIYFMVTVGLICDAGIGYLKSYFKP